MPTPLWKVDTQHNYQRRYYFLKNCVVRISLTPSDYVSIRNEQLGSWYIRSLVEVFAQNAHEKSLQSMFTKVTTQILLPKYMYVDL